VRCASVGPSPSPPWRASPARSRCRPPSPSGTTSTSRGTDAMANMAQAIRMALHYAETNLGVTDIFGQDAGPPLGGVFTVTQGLKTAWNTPLDERGIIGMAMGIAMAGGRDRKSTRLNSSHVKT